MMHLQDLVGADKMKSWYERFDLENQLKVCLMEKHLVKLDGVMSCNKNVIIWSIDNCNTCSNVTSTISVL